MIRVLHSIDTTGPGGAETVFVNLVKGLDPETFESFAVIRGEGWVCETLRSHEIEPIFVQSRGSFNIKYLLELMRIIRKYRIDIVQSHLLGSNLYCCLAGVLCRVPVITTFHGFVDTSAQERLMGLKTRMINLGSSGIVFVSDGLRKKFVQTFGFSNTKSVTIYNGVDTEIFHPQRDTSIREQLGLKKDDILIGAVGNIRPAKGYDLFLQAARIIHEQYPGTRFVVAGQGAGELYDSLLRLRQELKLEDVFFFLGFQNDAPKFLNNLDIFCLPSTSEGFSISTIEAMACGVPVVATRSGGPEEIISDGEDGRLVKAAVDEIAQSIISLIEDLPCRQRFSVHSIEKIDRCYSIASMIRSYESLLVSNCL
ncbi:MAG: glycosyltransferase [Desulfobulbaceae bacterium]|nr:MAG: glycosyltransferase [Desulfobulbaceae bacterium]